MIHKHLFSLPILLAIACLSLEQTAAAATGDCYVEAEGSLFHGAVGRLPQLLEPTCLVQSATTTLVTVMDGRLVDLVLGHGPKVFLYSELSIRIPSSCSNTRAFLRTFRSTLLLTGVRRQSEVGNIDTVERPADVTIICGADAAHIAIDAGEVARLVITQPPSRKRRR